MVEERGSIRDAAGRDGTEHNDAGRDAAGSGDAEFYDERRAELMRKSNKRLRIRTVILLLVCGVVAFMVLAIRLYKIQIVQNDFYESEALLNQLNRTTLTASRGTIYDASGKILAMSAAVENVFISPFEIDRDNQDISFISYGLSEILGVDREPIISGAADLKSQYLVVKSGVEYEEAGLVRSFIVDNEIKGVYLEPATRRYYPNSNLASQVLGFVGTDDIGLDGIEQRYNDMLTGADGRKVRLRNANGTDLLLPEYDDYYAAKDGNNVMLTIDSSIQYYVEKHLAQAVADYDVINGAMCIAMNAKTGAILAIANYPTFDPNNFLELSDSENAKLSEITDEDEYAQAYYAAQLRQWRNRALADTYEPGSVFKLITLAMALEENVTYPDDTFFCGGSMDVQGREPDDPLHCWNLYGHGTQTLREAMQNSCNLMSAQLGLRIGARTYYKYIDAFGLFDKTGLDNEAEGGSLWWDESVFYNRYNQSQLASASFGQTFKVTPIQMITAAAAAINGGYLMKPYIVRQVTDCDGNVIEANEPTVLRQVISSETSAKVREILEDVVEIGTGSNAQVRGYRVGGKTGTSENIEQLSAQENNPYIEKDYIVSFLGFAPADDPEIIILLILDTPSHDTGLYISGGAMAAPAVGSMMADILPLCLGIRPQYTEEDMGEINVDVPKVTGKSTADAAEALIELGFEYRIEGDGASVTGQLPKPNAYVASGTTVILYTEGEPPTTQVNVPSLSGLSYIAAKVTLESRGLFIRTTGAPRMGSRTGVSVQSIPAGEQAAYGSIIEVTLINKDASERN